MSLHEDFDKGSKGAKRASWSKLNYRDLALKVCEAHPDANVEDLASLFLQELEKYPGYLQSIAVYIMANVRTALNAPSVRTKPRAYKATLLDKVVAKTTAQVLMRIQMPNGKTLAESTGAECKKAGGWLVAVGEKVGDRNIVSTKLTEADLHKLLKK